MSIDLGELERLAKAATPGLWEQGDGVFDPSLIRTSYKVGSNIIGDIIHHKALRRDTKGRVYVIKVCGEQWRENAAYIVAACNAVPELIAENHELRAMVAELERQREFFLKALNDNRLCPNGGCFHDGSDLDEWDCTATDNRECWIQASKKEAGE